MPQTIQEILREHHVEFVEYGEHHHTREGWIQLRRCPCCGSDNFHLGFNLQSRFFACWKCGGHYGPQVFSLLGLPRSAAKALFPHLKREGQQEGATLQTELKEPAGRRRLSDCARHQQYLKQRGFAPATIAQYWRVEGIQLAARLSWRLYIPVTQKGETVSWTTRSIGDHVAQRYVSAAKNEERVNIKKVVYGADLCCHSIVICEGPTDAWAIGPGAGALFGTAFTSAQVRRLAEFPYRYVCFDSSPDAQAHARSLARLLSAFPGVTQNVTLDAKDPAEASSVELALLRKATRLG